MTGKDAQRQQLEALVEIGRVLVSTGDYERVLATMIATVSERMGAESAGFCLYDADRNELALQRPAFGLHDDSIIGKFRISLTGGSRTQKVFTSREPFLDNDLFNGPIPQPLAVMVNSWSVVVAPLVVEDRAIGVVSVMNKKDGLFTQEDMDLLMLMAPHLAVTIESAAMFREVREQRRQLERAVQVHNELSKAVLEAPDIEPLTERLASLVGRSAMVLDANLRELARAVFTNPRWAELAQERLADELTAASSLMESPSMHVRLEMAPGERGAFVVARVAAGNRTEGYILVDEDPDLPMDVIDVKALEHAATIFAFQLLRQRTAYEVERRLKGDLFQALFGQGSDREARRLLDRLGYRSAGPWRVARLEVLGSADQPRPEHASLAVESRVYSALSETWARAYGGAPLAPWRSGFMCVLPEPDGEADATAERNRRLADDLNTQLAALAPDLRLLFSLGSRVSNARDLARSLERAEDALAIAQELDMRGQPVYVDGLGVHQVLLSSMHHSQSHDDFVQQVIGPLVAYDDSHRTDLVGTLRTLVATSYVHGVAAEQLFLHPNTLRQRARRIEQLLDADLSNSEARFGVELALKLLDLQQMQARKGAAPTGRLSARGKPAALVGQAARA